MKTNLQVLLNPLLLQYKARAKNALEARNMFFLAKLLKQFLEDLKRVIVRLEKRGNQL